MASLLDLPPELINLIIKHLLSRDKPPAPSIHVRKRPRVATGAQLLCPCYDVEGIMQQLLTQAGTGPTHEGEDVVSFGISHPYIQDCVVQAGCCEMVDVRVTVDAEDKLIALPPSEMTIPCAVRAVNVVFLFSRFSVGPLDTARQQGLPLFSRLKRYPQLDRLLLDCSASCDAEARLQSTRMDDKTDENAFAEIRHLRIHLPHQFVLGSTRNPIILSDLAQIFKLPRLKILHIAMEFSDRNSNRILPGDMNREAQTWMTAFKCLETVATTWKTVDTVKVCAHLSLGLGDEAVVTWDLWRGALTQIVDIFRNDTSRKIELCMIYTWGMGYSGIPLDLFEDTGNGEWALKNNLAPASVQSVRDTIEGLRETTTIPVPNFDLIIGCFDFQSEDGISKNLVKIRYRQQDANSGCPGGVLECDFDRRISRELHRHSWICHQSRSTPRVDGATWREILQRLQEDYAKAFPDSGGDNARASSQ